MTARSVTDIIDQHERERLEHELRLARADARALRHSIKEALALMASCNDRELGEGGVARQAYGVLHTAYFMVPVGPWLQAETPDEEVSGA